MAFFRGMATPEQNNSYLKVLGHSKRIFLTEEFKAHVLRCVNKIRTKLRWTGVDACIGIGWKFADVIYGLSLRKSLKNTAHARCLFTKTYRTWCQQRIPSTTCVRRMYVKVEEK